MVVDSSNFANVLPWAPDCGVVGDAAFGVLGIPGPFDDRFVVDRLGVGLLDLMARFEMGNIPIALVVWL